MYRSQNHVVNTEKSTDIPLWTLTILWRDPDLGALPSQFKELTVCAASRAEQLLAKDLHFYSLSLSLFLLQYIYIGDAHEIAIRKCTFNCSLLLPICDNVIFLIILSMLVCYYILCKNRSMNRKRK